VACSRVPIPFASIFIVVWSYILYSVIIGVQSNERNHHRDHPISVARSVVRYSLYIYTRLGEVLNYLKIVAYRFAAILALGLRLLGHRRPLLHLLACRELHRRV
jgi:hypothetical protein